MGVSCLVAKLGGNGFAYGLAGFREFATNELAEPPYASRYSSLFGEERPFIAPAMFLICCAARTA
jgi:hypothetical protein